MSFDFKIRCEVQRVWRRVAVASVDHPYMMYEGKFLYKQTLIRLLLRNQTVMVTNISFYPTPNLTKGMTS